MLQLIGKLDFFPSLHLAAAMTFLCTLSNSPFLLILKNKKNILMNKNMFHI